MDDGGKKKYVLTNDSRLDLNQNVLRPVKATMVTHKLDGILTI